MLMRLAPNPKIAKYPGRARRIPRTGAAAPTKHGWLRTVRRWIERRRQRDALEMLDDRLLADIGLTRCQAKREAANPFWR